MMKQQKHRTKILSFVLSVLMLLGVPLPAFAEAAVENAIEEAQNQPVLMADKLTETETYWQNADGSITYESHLEPIRYQDEEGNWHDIVNDVVQVDKSAESTDAFKDDACTITARNPLKTGCCLRAVCLRRTPSKYKTGTALHTSARCVRCRCQRQLRKSPWPPSPDTRRQRRRYSRQRRRSPHRTQRASHGESIRSLPTHRGRSTTEDATVSQGSLRNAQQTTSCILSRKSDRRKAGFRFHLKEDGPRGTESQTP